jgi:MoxR-like ATPase
MTDEWRLYQGDCIAHDVRLPEPPPWRRFQHIDAERGRNFQASEHEIRMVNAALYLRRPLLVTGPPGCGKSSLIYAVAAELNLGEVLRWPINSRSTLAEGLYRYDAVGRLRDASLAQATRDTKFGSLLRSLNLARASSRDDDLADSDIGRYLTLGPLGTALLPNLRPRPLLIDEIDKSDIDLPNDLLHVFEEGRFEIPELVRVANRQRLVAVRPHDAKSSTATVEIAEGRVETTEFPFVVITSNGERDLPPAFLRRCLRLDMPKIDFERLKRIIHAHLGTNEHAPLTTIISEFLNRIEQGEMLATDQLLNAAFLLTAQRRPQEEDQRVVLEALTRALNEK